MQAGKGRDALHTRYPYLRTERPAALIRRGAAPQLRALHLAPRSGRARRRRTTKVLDRGVSVSFAVPFRIHAASIGGAPARSGAPVEAGILASGGRDEIPH